MLSNLSDLDFGDFGLNISFLSGNRARMCSA